MTLASPLSSVARRPDPAAAVETPSLLACAEADVFDAEEEVEATVLANEAEDEETPAEEERGEGSGCDDDDEVEACRSTVVVVDLVAGRKAAFGREQAGSAAELLALVVDAARRAARASVLVLLLAIMQSGTVRSHRSHRELKIDDAGSRHRSSHRRVAIICNLRKPSK